MHQILNQSENSDDEDEDSKESEQANLGFYEQLKLRYLNKDKNDLDISSWFSSSSESDDWSYQQHLKANLNADNYMPQYRQEFGGIIIYDIDSIMPGQPLPDQSIDIDVSTNLLLFFEAVVKNSFDLHSRWMDIQWRLLSNFNRNLQMRKIVLQEIKTFIK